MLDTYLHSYLADLQWTLAEIDRAMLKTVVDVLTLARQEDRQILVVGNGGSAATASHLACDLGKGTIDFSDPQFKRFRVISLCDNSALMTALGNDTSFEDVFSEQLRMLMRKRDVVLLISASGNSPNLVRAAEYARAHGAITVALLGFGGGKLRAMVDYPLVVSSRNYGIAEDFHLIAQHLLTQYLRRVLAGPARQVAFLDRDGIINEKAAEHHYIEDAASFRFVDGAPEMLRELTAAGYALVVVTNQQGIGKGRMSSEALGQIHAHMSRSLASDGVALSGIFTCPHLESDGCFCRKPRPGLILRALNELPFLVDMTRSVMVGDSHSDVSAGQAAGLQTVLVSSANPAIPATAVVGSVREVPAALASMGHDVRSESR